MAKAPMWVYCWDSSVWFAWIKKEECHPIGDMELVAKEIEAEKADFLVPATVYEELQLTKCSPEQLAVIEAFLKRPNVFQATQTPAVGRKAAEIIKRSSAAGIVTKMNDARIAASALVFGATVIHSVDGDLLRLNESPIVDGLRIQTPQSLSGQRALP
jgi:predicted nucleic acid-binding protein